jgi:hypothetical protein
MGEVLMAYFIKYRENHKKTAARIAGFHLRFKSGVGEMSMSI